MYQFSNVSQIVFVLRHTVFPVLKGVVLVGLPNFAGGICFSVFGLRFPNFLGEPSPRKLHTPNKQKRKTNSPLREAGKTKNRKTNFDIEKLLFRF